MNSSAILLVVIAVLAFLMATSVIVNNQRNFRTIVFSLALYVAGIWSLFIGFFLMSDNTQDMLSSARIYYIASMILSLFYTLFTTSYLKDFPSKCRYIISIPAVAISVAIAIAPNLLIKSLELGVDGSSNAVVLNTGFYILYSVMFVSYFSVAAFFLAKASKQSSGKRKKHIAYIQISYLIACVFGMIFNLILPLVGNYELIWVGPLGVTIFISVIYVAIVKYGLFDIKAAAVRLMSYGIMILAVMFIYVTLLNFIFEHLLGIDINDWRILLINTILAITILAIFPLVNRLNTVLTDIFNSGDYDSKSLVNQLNKLIIENHNIDNFLIENAKIINKSLGTGFVYYAISENGKYRLGGSPKKNLSKLNLASVANYVSLSKDNIIQADTIPETVPLLKDLRKFKVGCIINLKYNVSLEGEDHGEEATGFILIGQKTKNRNFTPKDLDLLLTFASLTALAVENINYYQQIQEFNDNLKKKITIATASLQTSNRKLKKIDATKDEFINMASHQLRTPLTSIKGYISMILDGDAGTVTPAQRRFLEEAYYSSEKMVHIINDFLNVSRIQTGKFVIEKALVDFAKIAREEVDDSLESVRKAGLSIDLRIDQSTRYLLELDESHIRQVINNLIDNAIYYSDTGDIITISLYSRGSKVFFEVKDTGIGIPKDEQKNIFKKFFRASNARYRRPDGTGVGLYLSKEIITASKGGVILKSKEGQGSTFGFWLPKPRD